MIRIDTDSYQILGQKYGLPSQKCGKCEIKTDDQQLLCGYIFHHSWSQKLLSKWRLARKQYVVIPTNTAVWRVLSPCRVDVITFVSLRCCHYHWWTYVMTIYHITSYWCHHRHCSLVTISNETVAMCCFSKMYSSGLDEDSSILAETRKVSITTISNSSALVKQAWLSGTRLCISIEVASVRIHQQSRLIVNSVIQWISEKRRYVTVRDYIKGLS